MLRATLNISWEKNIHSPQQSYDYLHAKPVTSERRMPCAGHYWRPEQELAISDTSTETSVCVHQSTLHSLVQTMNDMQKKANPN